MSFCWFEVTKWSMTEESVENKARTWTEFSSADPSSAEERPTEPPSLSDGEEEEPKDRLTDGKCESASGSLSGSK